MFENLQEFVESLPVLVQWIGLMLVAMIPYVESSVAAAIGVLAGITPPIAIAAGTLGNILIVVVLVLAAGAIRQRATRTKTPVDTPRRVKARRAFDRYGVAGVSLLGPIILPSHLTAVMMVSFGASRNAVLLWQAIAIAAWGVLFGALAYGGVTLLAG